MQQRPLGPRTVSAIGLGGMPLSIEGRPDEARSLETIHAALDAGVTLIDTADAYHLTAGEVGHNESLIAKALKAYGSGAAPRSRGQFRQIGFGEDQIDRLRRVDDALWPRGARDRDDDRRERELPCERHLLRRHPVRISDVLERRVPAAEGARATDAAERAPGKERDADLGTVLHLDQRREMARRELVLHSDELLPEDAARDVDLLDRRVRDAREQDRAVVEELLEGADAVLVRHFGVRAVVVVQPDRAAQPLRGCLCSFEQVRRRAVLGPRPVARTEVATLGGDEHA